MVEVFDDDCHERYLVNVLKYGPQFAMYIDGEWWGDYVSKIGREVTHWMEIERPNLTNEGEVGFTTNVKEVIADCQALGAELGKVANKLRSRK